MAVSADQNDEPKAGPIDVSTDLSYTVWRHYLRPGPAAPNSALRQASTRRS
jgi:hypothetical protein